MRIFVLGFLILTAVLVTACSSPSSPQPSSTDGRLFALELKVQELERELKKDTAWLDPAEKGYDSLNTSRGGLFYVSLEDAQPYLDGYKVTLHIGNPSTVMFERFKIKAKWGKRLPDIDTDTKAEEGLKAYDEWEKSLQEKEISFLDELKPGAWNKVQLTLSPAKPDEFGHLEISMETDVLYLTQPR